MGPASVLWSARAGIPGGDGILCHLCASHLPYFLMPPQLSITDHHHHHHHHQEVKIIQVTSTLQHRFAVHMHTVIKPYTVHNTSYQISPSIFDPIEIFRGGGIILSAFHPLLLPLANGHVTPQDCKEYCTLKFMRRSSF